MESAIFGLIGVVVGAVLATVKDWWFDNRRRKKDLEILSIHVVCLFDRFVAGCIEVISDDGLSYGSPDKDGCKVPQVDHPTLDLMSIDVEWKSLPSQLMYEILSFPTLIEDANSYIDAVVEFEANPPDYEEFFYTRTEKFSELGLQAIKLTSVLRERSNLPEVAENEEGWSRRKILMKALESIGKQNNAN